MKRMVQALCASLMVCSLPVGGSAQVIDSFSSGDQALSACGDPTYAYHADSSILGGARELYGRDGHSCTYGGTVYVDVDATGNEEVELSGGTAPQQSLLYGTEIGTVYPGFGTPSSNTGTDLGISLTENHTVRVDIESVPASVAGLTIHIRSGASTHAWSTSEVAVGELVAPLYEFTGMTPAVAADIDGISFHSSVDAPRGSGLVFGELRFAGPIPHSSLLRQTQLSVGDANCPNGGVQFDSGIDNGRGNGEPDDGVLHDDEVTATSYVCNGNGGSDGMDGTDGADGVDVLIVMTPEPASANCAEGGTMVESGPDTNGNGMLDTDEVTATAYVCDGADGSDGADGTNGEDGSSSLIELMELPAEDANCPEGGTRVDTGLDDGEGTATAGDGVLGDDEIDATAYVCNGADGARGPAGADGMDGARGPEGPSGGCSVTSRPSGTGLVLLIPLGALLLSRRRRRR